MDGSIIKLLIGMILFDAVSFYLSFIRPPLIFAYYARGAFFGHTFMLIPLTIFTLWAQSSALERLAAEGIAPPPSITRSVGISTGIIIKGTWLFEASAPPNDVMSFNMREENRPGWRLTSQNPVMCIFVKDGRRLIIASNREWPSDPTTVMYKIE